ncbi:hypothetical protein ACERK3_19605 [Phycisphaerales bacterium AB-hyl4]|uniref:Cytochrome c domain-containing protein n=1 Tax=Natronomicrosphaera hydrolytica TaxID=3242702 RepID=A0ABV4UBU1_9BACT
MKRCLAYLWMLAVMTGSPWLVGCDGNAGADNANESAPAGESQTWLEGDTQEQLDQLADQFGGFSAAMVEVGYRYNELYFAGDEANWPLAKYHAEKIGDAIEKGIKRRPGRGASAQPFLNRELPALVEAIEAEDGEQFHQRYERLMNACNVCHMREDVAFIQVRMPEQRALPWGSP